MSPPPGAGLHQLSRVPIRTARRGCVRQSSVPGSTPGVRTLPFAPFPQSSLGLLIGSGWPPYRRQRMAKTFYLCDGNVEKCGKQSCYKRGFDCRHTSDERHAINPKKARRFVLDEAGSRWEIPTDIALRINSDVLAEVLLQPNGDITPGVPEPPCN